METKKIKVTPEGRDGVYLVDKKEIIKFIKNYPEKQIHNFISSCCGFLVGADWDKKSVINEIKKSERVALLTGNSFEYNYRHALSVISNNTLYIFDIGEISEDNLEIVTKDRGDVN